MCDKLDKSMMLFIKVGYIEHCILVFRKYKDQIYERLNLELLYCVNML